MPPEPAADRRIRALGTEVRVACTGPGADLRCRHALAAIRRVERRLSRFRPDSELSHLNADPREEVPVSALLRGGVEAALWAATQSDGLVDPTLLAALERAGYTRSLASAGRAGRPLPPAADAPRPAHADPSRAWTAVRTDPVAGTVRRPPGVRLDLGGTGKGYAADLAAAALEGAPRWLVDCGGDLRAGGTSGAQEVHVDGPGGARLATLRLAEGAVATSGIHARRWTTEDGREVHHLLDPATGEPAWTGLVQVTALDGTVVAAETRAKTALLRGAAAARTLLAEHGGLLVHDTGEHETVGPVPLAALEEVPS